MNHLSRINKTSIKSKPALSILLLLICVSITNAQEIQKQNFIYIPKSKTDKFFTEQQLNSCPEKMILKLRVKLFNECHSWYTHLPCTQVDKKLAIKIDGESTPYILNLNNGTLQKSYTYHPNSNGKFEVYFIIDTQLQSTRYYSSCEGLSPNVTFNIFKDDVKIGHYRLPDPWKRFKSIGYLSDKYMKKGLLKEIEIMSVANLPYDIPVYMENIPHGKQSVQKFLRIHPKAILSCDNGLIPCSVSGDYDGDGAGDILFSYIDNKNNSLHYIAAMGSGLFVEFTPCDNGIWKTIRKNGKDSIFIDDIERSSCTLSWNGKTLWGPPGIGD